MKICEYKNVYRRSLFLFIYKYIQGRISGSYGRSVFNVSRTVVFFSVMTERFYLPVNHVFFVVFITVTETKSSYVFRLD